MASREPNPAKPHGDAFKLGRDLAPAGAPPQPHALARASDAESLKRSVRPSNRAKTSDRPVAHSPTSTASSPVTPDIDALHLF
ncbi:MAG UNVERIFIED_CONTAM: hypothetical protein LVT10_02050 [Anaerolineae bacterium]